MTRTSTSIAACLDTGEVDSLIEPYLDGVELEGASEHRAGMVLRHHSNVIRTDNA